MWEGLSTPLHGTLVTLEPLTREHEAALFEASRDPAVWRWLPSAGPVGADGRPGAPDRAAFTAIVEAALAAQAAGREATFVTSDRRGGGMVVGSTRYLNLRERDRGLEIGWTWLAPVAWGTGVNVEAKLLMLAHAFDDLRCLRVEFKTDARNERSRAALAALPARFEGIFRRHMVVPSGIRDSAYYAVTDEDWPAVRDHLNDRLARALLRQSISAPSRS